MMHFSIPIIAHGCDFNRFTTENAAFYFYTADELCVQIDLANNSNESKDSGMIMKEIADRRYTWDVIGKEYFDVLTARS